MRGKDGHKRKLMYNVRITPAHAGKRQGITGVQDLGEDHPRPCGEKPPSAPHCERAQGSPPPMRGKAECYPRPWTVARITPAHAGKSDVKLEVLAVDGDHPRPCGEK